AMEAAGLPFPALTEPSGLSFPGLAETPGDSHARAIMNPRATTRTRIPALTRVKCLVSWLMTNRWRSAVEDEIVVEVPVACKSMVDRSRLCAAVAARATRAQRGGEAVDYAS